MGTAVSDGCEPAELARNVHQRFGVVSRAEDPECGARRTILDAYTGGFGVDEDLIFEGLAVRERGVG